jgi:hypothetical protein
LTDEGGEPVPLDEVQENGFILYGKGGGNVHDDRFWWVETTGLKARVGRTAKTFAQPA